MKKYINHCFAIVLLLLVTGSCKKKEYSMGPLTAPTDVTITTKIVGQDATHPDGDGSGDVEVSISGKNILSYMVDWDSTGGIKLEQLPNGTGKNTYGKDGVNKYLLTVVAYGAGGTATTVTKEVQVRSDFKADPAIITNLTGNSSKTWKVDKDIPSHFGVGPWSTTSVTPEWWSAAINEKVGCCNCFYTASFTFTKTATGFTLTVATPDGAFTKTGSLAGGLPGIPSTGGEACYSYGGGTSAFSFVRPTSGLPASAPSTKTTIKLDGSNTFIGYGAVLKDYEILSITATSLYLRVQGTETGNAWYLKLKAI